MACPAPVVNAAWTVTSPRFGTSLQVMVNARDGTVAGISLENGRATPEALCSRMSKVAGVSIPRLKFIVRVPPVKLTPNPRPHAGAPDPAGIGLCEPQPAIRTRRDCVGEPAHRHGGRGDRTACPWAGSPTQARRMGVGGDRPADGDPTDLIGVV